MTSQRPFSKCPIPTLDTIKVPREAVAAVFWQLHLQVVSVAPQRRAKFLIQLDAMELLVIAKRTAADEDAASHRPPRAASSA